MKKLGVLFVVFFVGLLFLQLVVAQDPLGGLEDSLDEQVEQFENVREGVDNIKEQKWDYLGKEWKKILLSKPFFAAVDGILAKVSFIFIIFFGEPYSFSLSLLLIIILWFGFFIKLSELMSYSSTFSKSTSWIVGLGLTMILALTGFFRMIVDFFGWIALTFVENLWVRVIIYLGIVILFVVLSKISTVLGKALEKRAEEFEKYKEKLDKKFFSFFVDELRKVFKKE